jgi:hypothetical protein
VPAAPAQPADGPAGIVSPTLAEVGIASMTPAQASASLRVRGICHTFRYEYPFDSSSGYAELWCDPPPGRITEAVYGSGGEVIVFVTDPVRRLHTPRPQPPGGWGC